MKRLTAACCFLLLALSLNAKAIRDEARFTGEKERISYAFGMSVGGDLLQAGLDIDYHAFMEGLKSAMDEEPTVLDRDEALEIVQDAFESAMHKQMAALREKEDVFLAENAAKQGVTRTDSGLQYLVLEEGSGAQPKASDTVRVHYEGALIDGTVFDSSYERDEPEDIPLDMVISGWAEGIMLMKTGGKHRIYIPSNMAYGERGAGQVIPPYSTLVFTVELLDIVKAPENTEEDQ